MGDFGPHGPVMGVSPYEPSGEPRRGVEVSEQRGIKGAFVSNRGFEYNHTQLSSSLKLTPLLAMTMVIAGTMMTTA